MVSLPDVVFPASVNYVMIMVVVGAVRKRNRWTNVSLNHCQTLLKCTLLRKFFSQAYLLTSWSRIVLEKLTGFQLVQCPALNGSRRFTTAFRNVCHLSLSWASSIQAIPPHPTSWRWNEPSSIRHSHKKYGQAWWRDILNLELVLFCLKHKIFSE